MTHKILLTVLTVFLSVGISFGQLRLVQKISSTAPNFSYSEGTLVKGCNKSITFTLYNNSASSITRSAKLFITTNGGSEVNVVWEESFTLAANSIKNVSVGGLTQTNSGSYKLNLRADNTSDLSTITLSSPIVPVYSCPTCNNPQNLTIVNDPTGNCNATTREISLSGNLSFGSVTVGQTSTRTLTISNTGNATLTVSSINLPSGFTADWTNGTISAGNSKAVTITFSPSATTSYGGTITVNSNKTSGSNTKSCSGTGVAASTFSLQLNSSMTFGTTNLMVGQSYPFSTTIRNTGGASWSGSFYLKNGSIDLIDLGSKTVNANGTVTLSGTYTPSSAANNQSLTLYYQTDGMGSGIIVPQGSYSNPITVNFIEPSPAALQLNSVMTFGTTNLTVGQSYPFSTTIRNTGGTAWSGSFYLKNGSIDLIDLGSQTVNPNGTVTLSGTYIPSNPANNQSLTLYYQTNGVGPGLIVPQGSYSNPITVSFVEPSPAALQLNSGMTFGTTNLIVGQSYPFSTTIRNTGGTAWSGSFYLKNGDVNLIDLGSQTVNANGTVTLSGTYTPSSAANNQSLTLYYQTNGVGPGVIVPQGSYSNPITVSFVEPSPAALQLNSGMTFGTTNLTVGQSYPFSTTIRNTGGTNWSGVIYLKRGVNNIDFAPYTINSGETKTISFNYTPVSAGVNVPIELFYQTNGIGDGTLVPQGSFSNPILVNIDAGPCNITDVSAGEAHDAACYLMEKGIIEVRSTINPDYSIIRQDVAKILYLSVFGNSNSLAVKFSTLYQDLILASDNYHLYAIALSYLEFEDGKASFDRDFINFNPGDIIARKYYVKALLEAFNISPSSNGVNPFSDVETSDVFYPYLKKAFELGITTETSFRPNDNTTRIEAFLMLYRVLKNSSIQRPSQAELEDEKNYFVPINYTQLNYADSKGLLEGVFTSYSKNAFSLNDIGFDLSFDIFYNSYKFELPTELYKINSLTNGWSHSYDMQLVEADGKGYLGIPYEGQKLYLQTRYRCLVLPDGSVNIFHELEDGEMLPITKGITSTLEKNGNQYTLTTKHKTVFVFEYKKDNEYGDPVYMITSITDRNNNQMKIDYLSNQPALISTVTAQSGRTLSFQYNSNDKLSKVIDNAINREIVLTYENDNLASFKDANEKVTQYHYRNTGEPHTAHLLEEIILPRGNKMTVDYEDRKAKSVSTSAGMRIDIDAKVLDNQSDYSITEGGKTINYVVDYVPRSNPENPDGMIAKVEGNGISTSFEYNLSGNTPTLVEKINSNGIEIDPEYDEMQNMISRTIVGAGITERFTYDDKFNLLTSYTDANGHRVRIKRDARGNVKNIIDALNHTTRIDYNTWGLPISITNPDGITVTYDHNKYGNVEKIEAPLGISTQITYDDASRPETVSINGQTTSYKYDLVDNLFKTTDALQHVTEYRYDDNYNLSEIINAKGKATSLTYDDNDLLETVSFGDFTEKYSYYPDGALETLTKPSGQSFTHEYDDKGRLTSNEYITEVTYYEAGIQANRMKSISNENGTLEYTYDNLNRLAYYRDYFGNVVSYKYDNVGNITQLVYPDNKMVTYTYDDNNRLKTVTADWLTTTIVTYDYRDDGLLSKETLANGIITTYQYDDAGRLIDKTIQKSDDLPLQSWDYEWDLSGNITSETASENLFDTYPSIEIQELEYSYNDVNRIESISGEENITFDFDDDGNCIKKNNTTYAYDKNDRLTQITGDFNALYEYDAFGIRRKAIRNGKESRYVLDMAGMEDVVMETDGNNNAQWYYIQGLGIVARISSDGNIQYYHHDFRGSTVAMTDANQNTTHQYSYDEFGTVLQEEEADYNEFRYVGKYGVTYENEALQFMRARFADNSIGRFQSEDPIWSTNLYPYADSNPITMYDYDGREPQICKNYMSIGGDGNLGNAIRHSCLGEQFGHFAHVSELDVFGGLWITSDSWADYYNNSVRDPLNNLSKLKVVRDGKVINADYQSVIEYKIRQEIVNVAIQEEIITILTRLVNELFAKEAFSNLSIDEKMKILYIALEKHAYKLRKFEK